MPRCKRILSKLSKNLKFSESSSAKGSVGAIGINTAGSALAPFYLKNSADVGVFMHTVLHSAALDRGRRLVTEHFEALRSAKRMQKTSVVVAERRYLFQALATFATQSARYLDAVIRILKGQTKGEIYWGLDFTENTQVDWRLIKFDGFWKLLLETYDLADIQVGDKLALSIVLSELPYELLCNLTDNRSRELQLKLSKSSRSAANRPGQAGLGQKEQQSPGFQQSAQARGNIARLESFP